MRLGGAFDKTGAVTVDAVVTVEGVVGLVGEGVEAIGIDAGVLRCRRIDLRKSHFLSFSESPSMPCSLSSRSSWLKISSWPCVSSSPDLVMPTCAECCTLVGPDITSLCSLTFDVDLPPSNFVIEKDVFFAFSSAASGLFVRALDDAEEGNGAAVGLAGAVTKLEDFESEDGDVLEIVAAGARPCDGVDGSVDADDDAAVDVKPPRPPPAR